MRWTYCSCQKHGSTQLRHSLSQSVLHATAGMQLDVAPSGYTTLHVVRPTDTGRPSRGGGLGVCFRQSVPVREHHLANKLQATTFELQLLRVGAASSQLTVVHVYRPQWMSTVTNFVDELADIIAILTSECSDNIIVCGDMNCPGRDNSSVDDELADCFESLSLTQLVNEATRRTPTVSNLLDVVATSSTTLVSNVKVIDVDHLSDHCLITADVVVRVHRPVITYTSRNIRAVDATMFESELRKSVLFTRPAATVDEYVSQLNDVLTHLLDKFAPARTRRRRPQKPITKWLSAEAVEAKRTRRRLERRWRATGDEADRLAYRRECRKANRLINESRTNHYRRRIQESGSDYRQRWRIVNELLHSKDSDKTRTDDENRRLCSTFAHYFVDKIVKLRDSVSDTLCALSVSVPSDLSFPSHRGSVLDILSPVTSDEVGRVLASSPAKSSTMDIIPTSLVLRCKAVFL